MDPIQRKMQNMNSLYFFKNSLRSVKFSIARCIVFSIFLFCNTATSAEPNFPNYTGYVNDFADIIDTSTKQKITTVCEGLKAKTGAELAVVVIKTIAPLDSKTYAVRLFEKWKIGEKGLDNGLLFLLAVDERRVEIEVGYGLEGVINDAKAGEILDQYVIPSFKQGNFSQGMLLGSQAIAQRIEDAYIKGETKPNEKSEISSYLKFIPFIFVVIIIFFMFFSKSAFPSLVGGILGGIFGFIFIGGIIGVIIGTIAGILFSFGGTSRMGGGGFYGMGGGFGGGGSEGGFGGFGGGRSGGGGAGRGF